MDSRAKGDSPVTVAPAQVNPVDLVTTEADDGNVTNRLGPAWLNHVKALFGPPSQRRLAQAALQVDRIRG